MKKKTYIVEPGHGIYILPLFVFGDVLYYLFTYNTQLSVWENILVNAVIGYRIKERKHDEQMVE